MTLPRDLTNYGAPYVDAEVVADAEQEQSADFANRSLEDLAQLTRSAWRAWVIFPTTATAAPTTVTPSAGQSMMGSGSGAYPTISKTATGRYSITYPVNWLDALVVTENIVFYAGLPALLGAGLTGQVRIATIVNNVITVEVRDSSEAFSDLSGAASVQIFLA